MKNVLGLILKKEDVVIDGKKMEVLSYFTSMGTPKKVKSIKLTINDVDEYVSDIKDIGIVDSSYFYVRVNTKKAVNDELIYACNDRYRDSCFMMVDGRVVEIKDPKLLDKINKYLSSNSINNIYNNITTSVIGQDEHVRSILDSILWNNHLINSNSNSNNIAKNKHNILLMGKNGIGKTEIIKQIASNLNLPIVIENAPAYSLLDGEGSLIDNMLLNLINITDGDMEYAKRGILVIDNFDQVLSSCEYYGKVNNDYIQKDLFKLIDGDVRKFKYDDELIALDTYGLTIVIIGNFDLDNNKVFGFDSKNSDGDINSKLLNLGFKKELIDRINKIRCLNILNKNDLVKVLKSRDGKLMNYLLYLKNKGVNVKLDDAKLDVIAKMAFEDGNGVRSLNRVVDNLIDKEFSDLIVKDVKVKRREL